MALACFGGLAALIRADDPEPKKQSDEEIKKLIVGKWEWNDRFGDLKFHTMETFNKDGTVERVDTINGKDKIVVKATWEIKDGALTTVVTEGGVGKGTTVKGKILSIDEKTQHLKMEAGADIKKSRVKD
jgi:hypothetical protein